ncbi:MAG: hypothetical protein M0Q90_16370 [Bacteroidales bacterium]|jgi:hypothetical protein|nr:hypothetical protein [Bacteroidales bacterium]
MAVVKFTQSIKYNGQFYAAYQSFEVLDKDLESLVDAGAVIVSQAQTKATKEPKTGQELDTQDEQENKPKKKRK